MFATLIGKNRISEEKLAIALVNRTLSTCEPIFKEITDYVNECPHFDQSPNLDPRKDLDFLITVFTCNITRIPSFLANKQDKRVAQWMIRSLAEALEMDVRVLSTKIKDCKSLMKRLNHPSKNLVYAMPKAFFHLYGLNQFQQEYFRDLNSPNPLYLKEMNQMMDLLVWNWDKIKQEYKIVQ